ncbi:MAG: hypothetical protein MR022_04675 [Ruminococcus sp.]|nr:hypothetical protein [Ruminococcus sp.]
MNSFIRLRAALSAEKENNIPKAFKAEPLSGYLFYDLSSQEMCGIFGCLTGFCMLRSVF